MTVTTLAPNETKTGDLRDPIRLLFEARSIAIIGASADPTKLGSSPLTAMQILGYEGRVSVVNPRYDELLGHRCYANVAALPDDVEAVMIVLPAAGAVDVAEQCVARGIRAIVMIPQGFGEAGGEGFERDQRMLALARQGVAIVGPNTNGIANVETGLAMSIAPAFQYDGLIAPGRISVVSQSGAMVSSLLTRIGQCGIGIAKTATCGNELVLTMADYVDYLVDDASTDVIVLYIESIRNMPAFAKAIARARDAGKPVIAIKVGESEAGEKATLSHTGAIAGSYRNTIAFLEKAGVYVAEDLETLALIAECLVRYDWSDRDPPAKPFIASISGGFAAHTADVMERLGMPLSAPSSEGAAALSSLPTQSHPVNPYDIAAQNHLIPQIIEMFRADDFNQLLFGLVLLKPDINAQVAQILIDAKSAGMDRLFALSPQVTSAEQKRFNEAGILLTDNTPALLKALRSIETRRRNAAAFAGADAPLPVCELSLPEHSGLIDEARSKALVNKMGIRTPQSRVLSATGEIGSLEGLSFPLVMKGLSDKIAHKTEHGLVALDLRNAFDAEAAWERIKAALAKADPDASEILVEEMVGGGLEAILGVQRDATIGPVIVVGAGGILVELLDDVVVLVPPFSAAEAKDALSQTRFGRLLSGYRGKAYDIDALAHAASGLGTLAIAQTRLASIDINPVLVQAGADGLIALDAKVMLS
jgi:acyl-CoA synthetase (NDP forming)